MKLRKQYEQQGMNRDNTLEIYNEAIKIAGLERKGKTMPYTSANGYMYSQVNKAGELGVRLSKEDTHKFDETYGAKPFMSYGAKMREYVLITDEILEEPKTVATLLEKGHAYVTSLPPK